MKVKTGVYKHYKGKLYRVIGVVRHSETEEEFVVYRALYQAKEFGYNSLWVRPAKMFIERVNIRGKTMPRFRYLGRKYNFKNMTIT